ncbi:hypothetical protein ABK040_015408 [Willaertia magna]
MVQKRTRRKKKEGVISEEDELTIITNHGTSEQQQSNKNNNYPTNFSIIESVRRKNLDKAQQLLRQHANNLLAITTKDDLEQSFINYIIECTKEWRDSFKHCDMINIPLAILKTTQSKLSEPFFIKEKFIDNDEYEEEEEEPDFGFNTKAIDKYLKSLTEKKKPTNITAIIIKNNIKFTSFKSLLQFIMSRYSSQQQEKSSRYNEFNDFINFYKEKLDDGNPFIVVFENAHDIATDVLSQWLESCASYYYECPIINVLRVDEKGKNVFDGIYSSCIYRYSFKFFSSQVHNRPLFIKLINGLFISRNDDIFIRPSFDILNFLIEGFNNSLSVDRITNHLNYLYFRHYYDNTLAIVSNLFFRAKNQEEINKVLNHPEIISLFSTVTSVTSVFGSSPTVENILSCLEHFQSFFSLHPLIIDLIEIAIRCLVYKENDVRNKINRQEENDLILELRVKIHYALMGIKKFNHQPWFRQITNGLISGVSLENIIEFLICWNLKIEEYNNLVQKTLYIEQLNEINNILKELNISIGIERQDPPSNERVFSSDSAIPIPSSSPIMEEVVTTTVDDICENSNNEINDTEIVTTNNNEANEVMTANSEGSNLKEEHEEEDELKDDDEMMNDIEVKEELITNSMKLIKDKKENDDLSLMNEQTPIDSTSSSINIIKEEEQQNVIGKEEEEEENLIKKRRRQKRVKQQEPPSITKQLISNNDSTTIMKIKEEEEQVSNQIIPKPKKDICICGSSTTKYDSVTCDICQHEFHKSCVGVKRTFPTYRCDSCRAIMPTDNNSYCHCRRTHNDYEQMIECEDCNQWYHEQCIGINIKDYNDGEKHFYCQYCNIIKYGIQFLQPNPKKRSLTNNNNNKRSTTTTSTVKNNTNNKNNKNTNKNTNKNNKLTTTTNNKRNNKNESEDNNKTTTPLISYCICHKTVTGNMICCEKCNKWFHYGCVGLTKQHVSEIDKYYCTECIDNYQLEITYYKQQQQNKNNKKTSNNKNNNNNTNLIKKMPTFTIIQQQKDNNNNEMKELNNLPQRIKNLISSLFTSHDYLYQTKFILSTTTTNNNDNRDISSWIEKVVLHEIFFLKPKENELLENYLHPLQQKESYEYNIAFYQPNLFMCKELHEKYPIPDIYLAKQSLESCKMNSRYEIEYIEWLERFAALRKDKIENENIQIRFNLQVRALLLRGMIELSKEGLIKRVI